VPDAFWDAPTMSQAGDKSQKSASGAAVDPPWPPAAVAPRWPRPESRAQRFLRPFLRLLFGGRACRASAVFVIGWLDGCVHPAAETARGSKNKHPSGQPKGPSSLTDSRHRCMASPDGVLRCK
jgi:hypothetical protein